MRLVLSGPFLAMALFQDTKGGALVNKKLDVPLNAMMLSMVVQLLLGLIYFGAATAFNAFSGVGVICLTLAYAAPILSSLLTGRKHIAEGSFNLGSFGLFCNVVALGKTLTFVLLRVLC